MTDEDLEQLLAGSRPFTEGATWVERDGAVIEADQIIRELRDALIALRGKRGHA